MAVSVTQERHGIWTIEVTEPERTRLRDTARALGMSQSALVGASFIDGIWHYTRMIAQINAHERNEANTGKGVQDNGKKTEDQEG